MTHYYSVENGAEFTDATIHRREDCDELTGQSRPLADSTVDAIDADECGACSPEDPAGTTYALHNADDKSDEDHVLDATTDEQIEAGLCPWCDDYEGDHVGRHASSAHPDEWDEYSDE